ncbi:MAG TPA: hypothetical protein VE964_08205 [Myxococcales bacterium]|nr:hypothetical protein [Myxococcales bacterium]
MLASAGAAAAQSSESSAQPTGSTQQTAPAAAPPAPAPTAAATPAPKEEPSPWKGRLYSWASVGTTFAYGTTYGSANVGVGYLMRYGIAPNVEAGYTFGNTPTFWTVRPGVTWYMPLPLVHPYVGGYYTHWFVGSGFPDQDGIGGRAGLTLFRALTLGVTYDHALGCSRNCDVWTPLISAGLSL